MSSAKWQPFCRGFNVLMVEEWKSAVDNGTFVSAVALDLDKAFLNLSQGLLIAKLAFYRIGVGNTSGYKTIRRSC